MTDDAVSVACPLRDAEDNVIAALSVVVTAGRHDPIAVVPAVRTAARAVSRALGSRAAATGGTRA
jgi:DNA-binding IclR family transcriptional regulator